MSVQQTTEIVVLKLKLPAPTLQVVSYVPVYLDSVVMDLRVKVSQTRIIQTPWQRNSCLDILKAAGMLYWLATNTPGWLPTYLVQRLQSVGLLNAAAWVISHLRSADHLTDAGATLHWLRVSERIEYKIALLTFRVLHGSAPPYFGPLMSSRQTVASFYRHQSSSSATCDQPSIAVLSHCWP